MKGQIPASLASVPVANSVGGKDSCVRLVQTWRNRRDLRDSYVKLANQVEDEIGLGKLDLPVELLQRNETFFCVERALMVQVETGLFKAANPALLQLAQQRLSRFWADVKPEVQARWALISSAAEVLIEAERVGKAIKQAPATIPALLKAYTDDDEPWCLLDTHHRNMESRHYSFDFGGSGDHPELEKLITKAEQRYTEVGSELAKHFMTAYQKAKPPVKGVLQQREVFEKKVKPLLGDGKVAYVWVDALRFEMARELSRLLKDDFDLSLQPAVGTIPTITEIGMAALLPKANESAKVVAVGGGKVALDIGGTVIKDRKDRVAFLRENAGVTVFEAKREDLLPEANEEGEGRHPGCGVDPHYLPGN
ncbi:MAG: PglZ domain-containing protein [Bryobacterales bacterium]|nr:PglZ domain-containing protein [Bryobacterales bacterium]